MTPDAKSALNAQTYEEAAAWLLECRSGNLGEGARREFDRWLRKSPAHLAAYLELAAVWDEGASLDAAQRWDMETLIAQAREDGANVIALRDPAPPGVAKEPTAEVRDARGGGRWTHRRRGSLAAAVGCAALGLACVAYWLQLRAGLYVTETGEQRSIALEDGSLVQLNAGSRLRVHFGARERDVELLEGEALFHVAKDPGKPFIVSSGGTRVRAVGTQFDVNRRRTRTIVTVLEGRVAVSESPPLRPDAARGQAASPVDLDGARGGAGSIERAVLLAAGDQATVTSRAIEKEAHPDLGRAMAWTQRRLVFDSASLADVAEEFNRYNRHKLVLSDPALDDFHVSGVFASTDPSSLVRFLRSRPGLTIVETGSEIRIGKDPASRW